MRSPRDYPNLSTAWVTSFCFTLILSGLFLTATSCQGDSIQDFSVNELQADFKQFRDFLEGSHPQLYRYTSKKTFDSLFHTQFLRIDHPMTICDFYEVLIPLVSRVGCGHTSLWAPEGFWDKAPQLMFPLKVYARGEELFAIHSYGLESLIPPGSSITSINGEPADSLIHRLVQNIWSDGFILSKRMQRLNAVFPYLYALHYGFPEDFRIEFQEGENLKEVSMDPVPRRLVDASIDSLYAPGGARSPELKLDLVDEQTAILRIGSFAYYDDVKGFQIFIDSSFNVIRDQDIEDLIIDLRGNDGGDPFCSSHLLSYIQREPVIYFRERYGQYARLNKPLPMAENSFWGTQYYLIDGVCFSTTGHITSLLKYHDLGTFIGEETGATFTCNDASHDVRLKHTGFRLQSARRSFTAAAYGFPMDQGIMPDHPVQPSIKEIISGYDAVKEYALHFIGAK